MADSSSSFVILGGFSTGSRSVKCALYQFRHVIFQVDKYQKGIYICCASRTGASTRAEHHFPRPTHRTKIFREIVSQQTNKVLMCWQKPWFRWRRKPRNRIVSGTAYPCLPECAISGGVCGQGVREIRSLVLGDENWILSKVAGARDESLSDPSVGEKIRTRSAHSCLKRYLSNPSVASGAINKFRVKSSLFHN